MAHLHAGKSCSKPVLLVTELCKGFRVRGGGMRRDTVAAVDGVSLQLDAGRTLGLVGESGSGKSTVARILAGIERADAGQVLLDGQDLAAWRTRDRRRAGQAVQMVFQNPSGSLDPRMKIADILAEPLDVQGRVPTRNERHDRIKHLLSLVGLDPELLARYPHALSGGQRQRVGIARALALEPRLLVADEPVAALDVSVAAQIVNLLGRLQRQLDLALLFISHDLRMVRHLADDVAVMHRGRIVECGPTSKIFTRPEHPYTQALLAAVPRLPLLAPA